jgi:hypothetical protein
MTIERTFVRAALVLFAIGSAACTTTAPGTDGETHFVCRVQSDCSARGIAGPCVAGKCVGHDGGAPDATTLVDSGSSQCERETLSTPFPNIVFSGVRVALPTFCEFNALPPCPAGPAEVLRTYVCGPESSPPPLARSSGVQAAHRAIGCGYEFIYVYGVATSWIHVFSVSTGELVGAAYITDESGGPCNSAGYVAGVIPDCPEARRYFCAPPSELAADAGAYAGCRGPCDALCPPCATCSLVQQEALRALPERSECDCSVPPGVDPCLLQSSCGCWCEQITGLKEACPGVR